MKKVLLPFFALAALTACGTGPVGTASETASAGATASAASRAQSGVTVPTEGYETYVTQHNGFTRVRRSNLQPDDEAVLAQFDSSGSDSPAGFRRLIDMSQSPLANRVHVEAIGEMDSWTDGNGDPAEALERVLRLTTDVERFTPEAVVAAGGEIVLSGTDYSVVRIGEMRPYANQSDDGALYLALNFDRETAAIRIINRTLYQHCAQCQTQDLRRIDLLGEDLPFNVQTGAFGGEVEGNVYELMVRLGSRTIDVNGTVLGQVGGSEPGSLVAGGVFEASGSGTYAGQPIDAQVEGVFWASN